MLTSLPAWAQTVYRWVDDDGEVHYTDDKNSIPAAKRKAARVTEGDELGIAPSGSASKGPAKDSVEKTPVKVEVAPSGDDAERQRLEAEEQAEKEWRGRFRAAHQRVEQLEKLVEADKRAVEDPNAAGVPVARPDYRGVVLPSPELEIIKRRLGGEQKELARAREDLADLERDAARKAIPLEWRR